MRRTVLVVEDEPLLLTNVADELVEAGFDVVESSNADHALRQIASNPDIAVLFTDVDMPGSMDGLGLSSVVSSRWPEIAVIVTSGKLSPDRITLPAVRFIPKPYAVTELIHAINSALGK